MDRSFALFILIILVSKDYTVWGSSVG